MTAQVQDLAGEAIAVALMDQGEFGDQLARDAEAHGMHLEVVKLPTAKNVIVLLPRR